MDSWGESCDKIALFQQFAHGSLQLKIREDSTYYRITSKHILRKAGAARVFKTPSPINSPKWKRLEKWASSKHIVSPKEEQINGCCGTGSFLCMWRSCSASLKGLS